MNAKLKRVVEIKLIITKKKKVYNRYGKDVTMR